VRLLVVEDDDRMADLLRRALLTQGYGVDVVGDGEQALAFVEDRPYDAIILDILIPPPDGLSVLTTLRAAHNATPVLMLSALDSVEDRVAGLDWGADDYLTKPFELSELFARVRSITRRPSTSRPPQLSHAGLVCDPAARTVSRAGTPIALTVTEFALLLEFMRHPGVVLSRTYLLEHVWDPAAEHHPNLVDVYVGYLREKIDRPWKLESIQTVRGAGYRFATDDAAAHS
jgi:two-component system OmpR family response regulator